MKIKNNIKIFFFFIVIVVFHSCVTDRSNADNTFDVSVAEPKLSALRPKVLFDESHKEHHQIERTYKPLADLITNDGCIVNSNLRPIDKISLSKTDIYAIVTAMGKEDPGAISPFTTNEINSLENWVSNGGSLLLVTEHYPFGLAMKPLLNKFGIDVHNGYTEDTLLNATDVKDALLFEKSNRNLNATHPICQNVERVYTFTGASIKGDSTCIPLLIFSNAAQNFNVKVEVNRSGGNITTSVEYADYYLADGYCQGLCKQFGKGRIVVLAESAFLTAQIDKNGSHFGMNIPKCDNKKFALNIFRWLAFK